MKLSNTICIISTLIVFNHCFKNHHNILTNHKGLKFFWMIHYQLSQYCCYVNLYIRENTRKSWLVAFGKKSKSLRLIHKQMLLLKYSSIDNHRLNFEYLKFDLLYPMYILTWVFKKRYDFDWNFKRIMRKFFTMKNMLKNIISQGVRGYFVYDH